MKNTIDPHTDQSAGDWRSCLQCLYHEAELLDQGLLADWLALLSESFEYRVLNRVTRERESKEASFVTSNYHVLCDRSAMETRIKRLQSEFAWSEDTPTVTRRFVSNMRATRVDKNTLRIKSYLLLFRARWESSAFVSAERDDEWTSGTDGQLRLAKRWVYLDHSVLPIDNLGAIL